MDCSGRHTDGNFSSVPSTTTAQHTIKNLHSSSSFSNQQPMSSLSISFDECVVDFENQRKGYETSLWFFMLVPSLIVVLMRRGSCFYPYSQLLFDRAPIPFELEQQKAKRFVQSVLVVFFVGFLGIVGTIAVGRPRCACGQVSQCNSCRLNLFGFVDLGRCHSVMTYLGVAVNIMFVWNIVRVVKILNRTATEYSPVVVMGSTDDNNDDDNYDDDRVRRGGEIAMT